MLDITGEPSLHPLDLISQASLSEKEWEQIQKELEMEEELKKKKEKEGQ